MAQAPYAPPPAQKKSGAGLIIGLVVGIAVLGAGGYFGYKKFFAKGGTTEQAATQSTEPTVAQPVPGSGTVTPAGTPAGTPAETPAAPAVQNRTEPAAATTRTAPAAPAGAKSARTSDAAPQWPSTAPSTPPQQQQQQQPPASAQWPPAAQTPQAAPPAAPPEPVQEQPKPAQRTPVFRPDPEPTPAAPAAKPRYSGPASGTIIWSGPLKKDGVITIDGSQTSAGTLQGALPGVPVTIETDNKDVGFAEMPGPSNGWKKVGIRGRRNQNVVVTLRWKVL